MLLYPLDLQSLWQFLGVHKTAISFEGCMNPIDLDIGIIVKLGVLGISIS